MFFVTVYDIATGQLLLSFLSSCTSENLHKLKLLCKLLIMISGFYSTLKIWRSCWALQVPIAVSQTSKHLGGTYMTQQRLFASLPSAIPRNPSFSNLNSDDVSFFRSILGDRNVVEDEDRLSAANLDWMRKYKGSSQLLLLPKSSEEVPNFKFVEVLLLFYY